MSMENIRELFLEDETFEDARQKFNTVLQRLFRSMIDTDSNEGSITLKMDVSMQTEFIPNHDPDVEGESRQIRLPQFAYKVSSSITVKDEQKGNKNPQMELVWDDNLQKYVLQYVANTDQRSIFDKDFQENMNGGNDQEGIETSPERDYLNVGQLPGPVADEEALPGEVIDGDFREVSPDEAGSGDSAGGADGNGENPEDEPQTPPDGNNEVTGGGYEYEEPAGDTPGVKKCITGWSRYGTCSCCGYDGVQCCTQCKEPCNSRCGWIDEPYTPDGSKDTE